MHSATHGGLLLELEAHLAFMRALIERLHRQERHGS